MERTSHSSESCSEPLRILCLHGHNSNNDITRYQVLGLKLGQHAQCEYLHAPHPGASGDGLELFSDGPWYTWGSSAEAFQESLEYFAHYLQHQQAFDGVYAFSQGVAVVTAMSNPDVYTKHGFTKCPWEFCILACGGAARLVKDVEPPIGDIGIPSLFIKGERDYCLEDSTKLETYWTPSQRTSYTHKGGHEIDMQLLKREPELEKTLVKFLKEKGQNKSYSALVQEGNGAKEHSSSKAVQQGCHMDHCSVI